MRLTGAAVKKTQSRLRDAMKGNQPFILFPGHYD